MCAKAIGCILHFLLTQVHPFEDGAKLAILNGKLKLPKEGEHKMFFDLNRMYVDVSSECDTPSRPHAQPGPRTASVCC
jgi:hypothetical protein